MTLNLPNMSIKILNLGVEEPQIQIVEQPGPVRFRYDSEKSAGFIYGVNSNERIKTFPTIKITGYEGYIDLSVSLVTEESPHQQHPHKLVLKNTHKNSPLKQEDLKDGVFTLHSWYNSGDSLVFDNLGIRCVKKKDIVNMENVNLNVVLLKFEIFLEGLLPEAKYIYAYSNPITKKSTDLVIYRLSDNWSEASGDRQIILLCSRITDKKDIKILFYEEENGEQPWISYGKFETKDVYADVSITFKTPEYKIQNLVKPVKVFLKLVRTDERQMTYESNVMEFYYTPNTGNIKYPTWDLKF